MLLAGAVYGVTVEAMQSFGSSSSSSTVRQAAADMGHSIHCSRPAALAVSASTEEKATRLLLNALSDLEHGYAMHLRPSLRGVRKPRHVAVANTATTASPAAAHDMEDLEEIMSTSLDLRRHLHILEHLEDVIEGRTATGIPRGGADASRPSALSRDDLHAVHGFAADARADTVRDSDAASNSSVSVLRVRDTF